MKHTPRPWHVETDKGTGYCVYNFEGKAIAAWLSRTDARLIAAAPELLEALKSAASAYCSEFCTGDADDPHNDRCEGYSALIAKAEDRDA